MKSMGKILFVFLLVLFSFILRTGAQTVLRPKVSADKRYLTDQRNMPFPIPGSAITLWHMVNHAPFNGEGEIFYKTAEW